MNKNIGLFFGTFDPLHNGHIAIAKYFLKEVNLEGFERQEIKANPVTVSQLEEMYSYTNSYEALFNKRAKKYIN